jgi:hypothetical protein
VTIGFPQNYCGICRTKIEDNLVLPVDQGINSSLLYDMCRSQWRRIANDGQSASIQFQRLI